MWRRKSVPAWLGSDQPRACRLGVKSRRGRGKNHYLPSRAIWVRAPGAPGVPCVARANNRPSRTTPRVRPRLAWARPANGAVLCSAGRAKEAIPHVDHAMRLSPRDIFLTRMLTHRAFLLFDLERYEEAFEWVRRVSMSFLQPRHMFGFGSAPVLSAGGLNVAPSLIQTIRSNSDGNQRVRYSPCPVPTHGRLFQLFGGRPV